MSKLKTWLCGVLVVIALVGAAAPFHPSFAVADERERAEHWRHHDGHWSYWHEGDKRWYYTDGSNWFYNTNDGWKVYRFDGQFGKSGFERGEYKAPGEGIEIETPRHRIYIPR